MRRDVISSFVALAFCLGSGPLLAQSGDPIGFVERKRGTAGEQVWIERGNKKFNAAPGAPVYAGDVIKVRGDTASRPNFVQLRIAGRKGPVKVTPDRSFRIEAPPATGWYEQLGKIAANVSDALGITDRVTDSDTFTRSSSPADRGRPATAEPLTRVAALDTNTLYAAEGLDLLALRWCGDAADVQLAAEGFPITSLEKSNAGFGSVDLAGFIVEENDGTRIPADEITIRALTGADLKYQLKWVDLGEVPRPVDLVDKIDLSSADKIEWANWLIADAEGILGDQYNLIAFSLLAEARDDIWLSSYLLERASFCPDGTSTEDQDQ